MNTLTEQQKREAAVKIAMLEGSPPYNTPSNICYGDGYFAQSIVREYGMSISTLKALVLSVDN